MPSPSPYQDAVDLTDELLTLHAGDGHLTVPDHHYGAIIAVILMIVKHDEQPITEETVYDILNQRTPARFKTNRHYARLLELIHTLKVAA